MRLVTNLLGAVEQLFIYDAYGADLAIFNTASGALASGAHPSTTVRYNGEYFDSAASHYYLRARHYDPLSGRFPSLDPYAGDIYTPLSYHKYGFVHGDPIQGIDPSGLVSEFSAAGQLVASAIRTSIAGSIIAVGLNSLRNFSLGRSVFSGSWEAAGAGAAFGAMAAISPVVGLVFGILGVLDGLSVAHQVLRDRGSSGWQKGAAITYLLLNGILLGSSANHARRSGFNVLTPEAQAASQQASQVARAFADSLSGGLGDLIGLNKLGFVSEGLIYMISRPGKAEQTVTNGKGKTTTIYGQGLRSSSKTRGHGETIEATAYSLAKTGKYTQIFMQRGLKTALGAIEGLSRNIADLILVRTDGKIDMIEVLSKTQREGSQHAKLKQDMSTLPEHLRGKWREIEPDASLASGFEH